MEDVEMTPMTMGTAVQVNTPAPGIESFGEEAMVMQEGEIVDSASDTQEVEEAPPVEEADMLLSSAKDEGFEEALTHLADGDFEKPEQEEELTEEGSVDAEVEEAEPAEDMEMDELEKQELIEKINMLEEEVTNLEEKTKELTERLKTTEANLKLSLETLLAMAILMHELIKKERDQKKKLSLFEFLINLMGKLLVSIADPDAEQKDNKKEEPAPSQAVETPDIDELLKYLKEKGMGANNVENIQQPHVASEAPHPLAA